MTETNRNHLGESEKGELCRRISAMLEELPKDNSAVKVSI